MNESMPLEEKKTPVRPETASMRDIARRLRVSVASVSRALNNQPGVGEELRRRILDEAAKIAYTPGPQGPTTGVVRETQMIAFLLHHRVGGFAQDPFYPAILHGLEQEAVLADYHVLLHSTSREEEQQILQLALFSKPLADGCVIAGPDIDRQLILDLWRARFPFILVDNYLENVAVDSVETDNINGSYALTRHLIEHGYRDIAIIHGPIHEASMYDRYSGYRLAMLDAGLNPQLPLVRQESGAEAARRLLQEETLPRAIVVTNDQEAVGVIGVLRAAGLCIPDDIALVGYDDIPAALMANPPLTTVHVHTEQMGREAARRLLFQLRNGQETSPIPQRIHIRNELVIRQSCGCHR